MTVSALSILRSVLFSPDITQCEATVGIYVSSLKRRPVVMLWQMICEFISDVLVEIYDC